MIPVENKYLVSNSDLDFSLKKAHFYELHWFVKNKLVFFSKWPSIVVTNSKEKVSTKKLDFKNDF